VSAPPSHRANLLRLAAETQYDVRTVARATGTSGGFAIGCNLIGGEFGNFRLMQLLGYSRVLTVAEWAAVMAYARATYGDQ